MVLITTCFLWLYFDVYVLFTCSYTCSFLCKFTDYLQSPHLTLFVATKWAEWRDLFSHDSLRGKVFTCLQAYLVRLELRNLFPFVCIFNIATKTYLKRTEYLDPNRPTACCYGSLLTQIYNKVNTIFVN